MNDERTVILVGGGATVSGKEIMLLSLGRGLRASGFRVRFIASRWGGDGDFVSRLRAESFDHDRIRLGFISLAPRWKPFVWTLDQLRYWPSLLMAYRRIVRTAKPHAVVHTNWHHALLLAPLLDSRRDIYWAHETVPTNARYRRVFRTIADRVAVVVCVSHAVARSVRALGVDAAKIAVVHNGASIDSVPPLSPERQLRLGIAGQVGEWKGHDDLIAAVASLGDASDVMVKIFGNGDSRYVAALRERAEQLGISDRVEWKGFVSDPRRIYDEIDVCVVPSRFEEPFGLVAVEAGLSGRPVIASRIGGLPEIVADGETGLLVEPGQMHSLAAAIASVANDPQKVVAMGSAAAQRCHREFSLDRFVERFVQVIDGLDGATRELRPA